MEELNFRPRKAVLVIWLIWTALGCLPLGGGVAAAFCADSEISPVVGLGLGGFIPWVVLSLCVALYYYSIHYHLDDRYVSKSSGVLWKQKRSIPLGKITNLDVRQGPLERLLGFGQIWIFTPSTGAATPEEKLIGVSLPHDMKQIIVDRAEAVKGGGPSPSQPTPAAAGTDANSVLLIEIRDALLRIEAVLRNPDRQG